MKLLFAVPALLLILPLFAADPAGFTMWTAADLKARAKNAKLDEHKAGLDRAANWGNHAFLVVHREGDGEAEVHETQVDVITVVSGEGTLEVGGTVVDGRTSAPNEIRGKSITGASSHKMAAGDVFHIPVKTPHRMLVPKSLTINVVKIDSK